MATLVIVKMYDSSLREIGSVFRTVWEHIKLHNRQKQSVVTVSWNSSDDEKVDLDDLMVAHDEQKRQIQTLMDNGVIVVVAAGNKADKEDSDGNLRPNIDMTPAIWEGPDYPLIVIGATDNTGEQADFSQGGEHLTISAPGVDIRCHHKSQQFTPYVDSGTSLGMFNYKSTLVSGCSTPKKASPGHFG